MAEQVDVGTAISLGTNLQPDRTRPLTQASQNWLQMEMRREAARAKKEQEREAKKAMVFQKLKGGKFDAVLNPIAKNLIAETYTRASEAPDQFTAQRIVEEANFELDRLSKRQEYRDKFRTQAVQYNSPKWMFDAFLEGKEDEIMKLMPYSEALYSYGGDVMLNMPKIKDLPTYVTQYMNQNASQMGIVDDEKKLQTGQTVYKKAFTDQQLASMANNMAENYDFTERMYQENPAVFNEKISQLEAKGVAPNVAKKQIAAQIAFNELKERNRAITVYSQPSQFGGGGSDVKKVNPYVSTFSEDNLFTMLNTKFPTSINDTNKEKLAGLEMPERGIAIPPIETDVDVNAPRISNISYNPFTKRIILKGNNLFKIQGGIKFTDPNYVEIDPKSEDRVISQLEAKLKIAPKTIKNSLKEIKVQSDKDASNIAGEVRKRFGMKTIPITPTPPTGGGKLGKKGGESFDAWKKRTGKTNYSEYSKS